MRYYISKIIGTGTETDPKRPKIAEYGVNFSITHSDQLDWCLGVTDAGNVDSLVSDVDVVIFPAQSLDTLVFSVDESVRNQLFVQIQAFTGQSLTDLLPTTTFRRVLEYLGAILEPGFQPENFRVG